MVCIYFETPCKWAKLFKEGQNSIQGEDRLSRSTLMSIPEMVDSVNALILTDRKVTIEDSSKQLGIFMDTPQKIALWVIFLQNSPYLLNVLHI